MARERFGPWAAIHKATGSWIGMIGLDELADWPDIHKVEVGFELSKVGSGPRHRGRLRGAPLRFRAA
jgi:hypothetical protein